MSGPPRSSRRRNEAKLGTYVENNINRMSYLEMASMAFETDSLILDD